MAANLVEKLKETLAGSSDSQSHGENQPYSEREASNIRNDHIEHQPENQQEFTGLSGENTGFTQQSQHASSGFRSGNLESSSNESQQPAQQHVDSLIDQVSGARPPSHQPQSQPESSVDRNPRDAAHVPPSVLSEHIGGPSVEHDYPHDSKTKRHSISHQEAHFMK